MRSASLQASENPAKGIDFRRKCKLTTGKSAPGYKFRTTREKRQRSIQQRTARLTFPAWPVIAHTSHYMVKHSKAQDEATPYIADATLWLKKVCKGGHSTCISSQDMNREDSAAMQVSASRRKHGRRQTAHGPRRSSPSTC